MVSFFQFLVSMEPLTYLAAFLFCVILISFCVFVSTTISIHYQQYEHYRKMAECLANAWQCFVCRRINDDRNARRCVECDAKRGDWKCHGCGFVLYASRTKCSKCHIRRPTTESAGIQIKKRGDWDCPQCGKHQFARNDRCRDCHTAKPVSASGSSNPKKREGDWVCANCGESQFAKNEFCRKCGQSKSGETGGKTQCLVCEDAPADTMLKHGDTGHTCVCHGCAQELNRRGMPCPMCRQDVDSIIRNYQ
jgi:predicted RNA-binding Zn-ribbon protein involved in translation (DUF1610 family)